MKRTLIPMACLLCVVGLMLGCSYTASDSGASGTPGVTHTAAHLCPDCGQVEDSMDCCVEGAVRCEHCGLVKDSPGCCKMAQGDDVHLCAKCGYIENSEDCCRPGAEVCEKCGLHKGSPLCCVVMKEGAEGGHHDDH